MPAPNLRALLFGRALNLSFLGLLRFCHRFAASLRLKSAAAL